MVFTTWCGQKSLLLAGNKKDDTVAEERANNQHYSVLFCPTDQLVSCKTVQRHYGNVHAYTSSNKFAVNLRGLTVRSSYTVALVMLPMVAS